MNIVTDLTKDLLAHFSGADSDIDTGIDTGIDKNTTHLHGGRHRGRHGRRYLIALAGVPGSGKTTLAASLCAEVNAQLGPKSAHGMVSLGMDGFHLTRAELKQRPDAAEALARRGAPWTFAPDALAERLHTLRTAAGHHAVGWPDFQHELGDPIENRQWVPAATRLVLVEGLYLLHTGDGWEAVANLFDERWYLDTPLPLALQRLASRHQRVWGISQAEAEARIATNDRLNAEIVQRSRGNADRIIKFP